MFPDNQNQSGGQPDYGQAPQPAYNPAPQQAPNGQYDVLPPLPVGQNNGHTGHNPYEFIVNPNQPKKPGLNLGKSFGMQIALIVGGAAVLMIVAAVVLTALKPKGISANMLAIAQRQQEIVRIATAAADQANGQDAKNFVTTVQLSVGTNQQQVLTYLKAHNTKVGTKLLAADQSTQTDTLLSNAANAGTYDSTVVSTLSDELKTYESLLAKTYKQATSKTSKQILQGSFNAADKLVTQAKNVSTTAN